MLFLVRQNARNVFPWGLSNMTSNKAFKLNLKNQNHFHLRKQYKWPSRDRKSVVCKKIGRDRNRSNGFSFLLGGIVLSFSNVIIPIKCSDETEKQNVEDAVKEEASAGKSNENDLVDDETSCPICRFYLQSPCREVFQKWYGCCKVSLS